MSGYQQQEDAILAQMARAQGNTFQSLGALIGGGHVSQLGGAIGMPCSAVTGPFGPHQAIYQEETRRALQNHKPTPRKEKSVFNVIATDVKSFVVEHRSILYFVVIALIVDHLLFRGVFKARLQAMLESMISKVEEKVAGVGAKP
jgi:hypothetical protein